jgi:hypothetical protein
MVLLFNCLEMDLLSNTIAFLSSKSQFVSSFTFGKFPLIFPTVITGTMHFIIEFLHWSTQLSCSSLTNFYQLYSAFRTHRSCMAGNFSLALIWVNPVICLTDSWLFCLQTDDFKAACVSNFKAFRPLKLYHWHQFHKLWTTFNQFNNITFFLKVVFESSVSTITRYKTNAETATHINE